MAKTKKITQTTQTQSSAKASLLYLFLLLLFLSTAFSLFEGEYIKFLKKIAAFILFFGAIKLLDRGLENEKEYQSALIAFAPKMKFKLFGAILLGVDVFFISYFINYDSLLNAIFVTLLSTIGVLLYYGLDPSRDKLPQESGIDMKKMLQELQEAQEKIDFIKEAQEDISDYELQKAIEEATTKAEHILETIKADPKDIKVARKFIVIYLDGIKDVIRQYKDIDKTKLDESFRVRLIELLELASSRFDKELDRLKSNEIFDLDVQIDALKQQLKE